MTNIVHFSLIESYRKDFIMADNFVAGQVVKLKSGGPKMTVAEAGIDQDKDAYVWCRWFAGSKLEVSKFEPVVLMHPAGGNSPGK